MVATFVIFLREGIEGSIIVAVLLAYLKRLGLQRHFRDVFLGVGAALLLVLVGGVTAYLTLKAYAGSRTQTIFETGTYLVAATVLTYMTFWMRSHAPNLSRELRERTDAALDGRARWGLALLAFQAVGREGLETMVFTLAIVFATSAHGVIGGGIAGLVVALLVAFSIYRLGARLNVAVFFKVVGTLLIIFAAGILADAVENLQQLGWITFLNHPVWDTSGTLSESSAPGDIVHSFFGYADRPTELQVGLYGLYVVVAVSAFILLGRRKRPSSTPPTSAAPRPWTEGSAATAGSPTASVEAGAARPGWRPDAARS